MGIIVLVTLIGLFAELRVKSLSDKTWLREGGMFGQTSCYVDRIGNHKVGKGGLGDFKFLETLNETVFHGGLNEDMLKINATMDPLAAMGHEDFCNVRFPEGADPDNPKVLCVGLDTLYVPHWSITRGIDHFIPFALLWFIYKLLYIGVQPVDRMVWMASGSGAEKPEPIFKLLTEPYYRRCTFFMQLVAKLFYYFRYRRFGRRCDSLLL